MQPATVPIEPFPANCQNVVLHNVDTQLAEETSLVTASHMRLDRVRQIMAFQ